jgi:hypothetical protein
LAFERVGLATRPRFDLETDVKADEFKKLEKYLRATLKTPDITVKALPRKNDTAEVYVGEEFAGLISKDEDEGELSYHFTMTILDIDLD